MAKIGRTGRLWLRGFHILFAGSWIGATLSAIIIPFIASGASDGGALHAYYAVVQLLDSIVIPSAVLTLITGLLLSWLTAWGFFKHGWVIYSGSAAILAIALGVICLGPGIESLVDISKAEGLSALQNPEYVSAWKTVEILTIVQVVVMISAVFISVLKPWRKHERAEAAA